MTQNAIKNFIDEIYSKQPKKTYVTNKTDVFHTDDIWSSDILAIEDYGPKIYRGYRHVLVVVDNFSKFAWTIILKKKNCSTIKVSFENIIITSKRKKFFLKPMMVENS